MLETEKVSPVLSQLCNTMTRRAHRTSNGKEIHQNVNRKEASLLSGRTAGDFYFLLYASLNFPFVSQWIYDFSTQKNKTGFVLDATWFRSSFVLFSREAEGVRGTLLMSTAVGEMPGNGTLLLFFPFVRSRGTFIFFPLFQHHCSLGSRSGNSPTKNCVSQSEVQPFLLSLWHSWGDLGSHLSLPVFDQPGQFAIISVRWVFKARLWLGHVRDTTVTPAVCLWETGPVGDSASFTPHVCSLQTLGCDSPGQLPCYSPPWGTHAREPAGRPQSQSQWVEGKASALWNTEVLHEY